MPIVPSCNGMFAELLRKRTSDKLTRKSKPRPFVDTLQCVRYAFEFACDDFSLLRRTDETPHG